MQLPITCNNCKARLGTFNDQTGCMEDAGTDTSRPKIFGAYLRCGSCGASTKFDGSAYRKRMKRKAPESRP